MQTLFYNIFLVLYRAGIRVASTWNIKARKWLRGRENIFHDIETRLAGKPGKERVWIHCSSLGEFEQARPIIEKIRERFPAYQIALTFFSPSGYEIRKNYEGVEYVFYLPADSRKNAKRFLDLVNPSLVIFVKYDYWFYYLDEIKQRKISCLLISAVFRNGQSFFKWYGSFQRRMLRCFTLIFVQDESSKTALSHAAIDCLVSGDTRFDRVVDIAGKFEPIDSIERFLAGAKCMVAGSTWPEDEEALSRIQRELIAEKMKLIVAPHEITKDRLNRLLSVFNNPVFYSKPGNEVGSSNVLIIDTIGLLSRAYKYSSIAYIGGGFTRDGVHNVLEAAIYGQPLIFGDNYHKYREAADLVDLGCAKPFSDRQKLFGVVSESLNNPAYAKLCNLARHYVVSNAGATEKILSYIQEKRLLTR